MQFKSVGRIGFQEGGNAQKQYVHVTETKRCTLVCAMSSVIVLGLPNQDFMIL